MGARARGLLLFSFAFSSVLSSPEIPVPSNEKRTFLNTSATELYKGNSSINVAINRGCFNEGSCSGVDGIQKREISYSPMNKKEELKKAVEMSESESRSPYPVNVRMNNGIEKRARVGFTGMRGKKDSYLPHNYVDKGTPPGEEDLGTLLEILEKRTRIGFNGMRGKKYDGLSGKRGQVMAFHGMRGKRLDDYDAYPEKFSGPDGLVASEETQDEELPEGEIPAWEKRTMAFHGMRGRRREDSVFAKRFPYPSGGMVQDNSGYDFKRTRGFLGMRGKKTPESWSLEDYGKRGVQTGFFGMKGKKAQSGFFGMRGKKSLPDALGIDGDRESLVNAINLLNDSDSPQERVRRASKWLKNSKKAKNAFFAARGKKSSDDYNESELSYVPSLE